MADSSVVLDRFYVKNRCTPTRAAMMTGRHPLRYGMPENRIVWPWEKNGLPIEETTIAQTLKKAGYYTAIVGKWHLGHYKQEYLPTHRGFDYHYGHYCGGIDYFTHQVAQGGLDWHRNEVPVEEKGYSTDLIGGEAVKLIETHKYQKSPLFLYVSFNAPHDPLQAKKKDIDNYLTIQDEGRRIFAAQVQSMDDAIGKIVQTLQEKQIWNNTLLFFLSDNGGATMHPWHRGDNRPLRGGKGTLYEGGVRVPAFLSYPRQFKESQLSKQTFSVVDLYPTFAKLAGVKLNAQQPIDGIDIIDSLVTSTTNRDELLIQYEDLSNAAIIKGDYKLVNNGMSGSDVPYYGTVELFNLKDDPLEDRNLANSEPEKVLELQKLLENYEKDRKPSILNAPSEIPKKFVVPKIWSPKYLQLSSIKSKNLVNNNYLLLFIKKIKSVPKTIVAIVCLFGGILGGYLLKLWDFI